MDMNCGMQQVWRGLWSFLLRFNVLLILLHMLSCLGFLLMEVKFVGALVQNPIHMMPCTFIHFLLIMAGRIDLSAMVLKFFLDRCFSLLEVRVLTLW